MAEQILDAVVGEQSVPVEHEINEAAYRRLEHSIKECYPRGQFVAIADGNLVGDSNDFLTLHQSLKASGRDPRKVLIVQAAHVYPRKAVIYSIG